MNTKSGETEGKVHDVYGLLLEKGLVEKVLGCEASLSVYSIIGFVYMKWE